MRTFNATDLNRGGREIFDAAVEDGAVKINHGRYLDTMFELVARPRGMKSCHHCGGRYMQSGGHEPGCPGKEIDSE
jgi:hypothetical protein